MSIPTNPKEVKRHVHAHLDCFSGAAGDMLLASCIDAYADSNLELNDASSNKYKQEDDNEMQTKTRNAKRQHFVKEIQRRLESLPFLKGKFELSCEMVWKGRGRIQGCHVKVRDLAFGGEAAPVPSDDHSHDHSHSHGHDHNHALQTLPSITSILHSTPQNPLLPTHLLHLAQQTFTTLAYAEAYTHGSTSPSSVHFHEVGAIDSLVDTLGTIVALFLLGVDTVSCSPLPWGRGTVWTDHGRLPVPAPAALRLFKGMNTCEGPAAKHDTGELVTPTGAALLRVLTGVHSMELNHNLDALGEKKGGMNGVFPSKFVPRAVGIGAGTKDFDQHPNVLRLILGDVEGGPQGFHLWSSDVAKGLEDTSLTEEHGRQEESREHSYQHAHGHEHSHAHEHAYDHSHEHSHDHSHGHSHDHAHAHDHKHQHQHDHKHNHTHKIQTTKQIQPKSTTPPHTLTKPTSPPVPPPKPNTPCDSSYKTHYLTHLQANIDDTTPEILAYTMEVLLALPTVVDAWVHPIGMKKGRAAQLLHCLCLAPTTSTNSNTTIATLASSSSHETKKEHVEEEAIRVIFRETSTLGIRITRNVERVALKRFFLKRVQTPFRNEDCHGCVNVKVGMLQNGGCSDAALHNGNQMVVVKRGKDGDGDGDCDCSGGMLHEEYEEDGEGRGGEEVVTVAPEYEDCKTIALATGVPLKQVMEAAVVEARRRLTEKEY